jgi:hypothetical protein
MGVGWTGLLWCVPSVSVNGHPGGGRAPGAADYRTGRDEGLSPGTALLGLWPSGPPPRTNNVGTSRNDTKSGSVGSTIFMTDQYPAYTNCPLVHRRVPRWAVGDDFARQSPTHPALRAADRTVGDDTARQPPDRWPPAPRVGDWRHPAWGCWNGETPFSPLLTGRIARRIDHAFGSVTSAFWQHQAFRARRPTAVDTLVPGRLAFAGAVAGWVHP